MSNVIALHSDTVRTAREMVAAEVRAELARQRLNSNTLPSRVGKSQRYWYQRINAQLSFSVDDLGALSAVLGVPMSQFVPSTVTPFDPTPETQKAPTPEGEGLKLPGLDSNQEPIGAEHLGDVIAFPERPAAHVQPHPLDARRQVRPIVKLHDGGRVA